LGLRRTEKAFIEKRASRLIWQPRRHKPAARDGGNLFLALLNIQRTIECKWGRPSGSMTVYASFLDNPLYIFL
jgi:hypothetical protein